MGFDCDWITLGRHRVRLKRVRGFPTEKTRSVAEAARIAIEHNLSAAESQRGPLVLVTPPDRNWRARIQPRAAAMA